MPYEAPKPADLLDEGMTIDVVFGTFRPGLAPNDFLFCKVMSYHNLSDWPFNNHFEHHSNNYGNISLKLFPLSNSAWLFLLFIRLNILLFKPTNCEFIDGSKQSDELVHEDYDGIEMEEVADSINKKEQ